MASRTASEEQDELIASLARRADERARLTLLRRHRSLHSRALVDRLHDEVVRRVLVNLRQAERLAHAAVWLAERLQDRYSRAQSLRAAGHVLYARAKYEQALKHYQEAVSIFQRLRRERDVARTLNGSLQTLIYLGRYDQAFAWAQKARRIFQKYGDRVRLARLDSNIGNILYRQDRFQEALEFYRRAHQKLSQIGEPRDMAAVLSNMAVCFISLNDFGQAVETYRQARQFCEQHGMPLLVAEADYNIAYLYYLRGNYTRAIELYQDARRHCQEKGDTYHRALCDLDQSEMYLELNLTEEGAELARQAFATFEELGMRYETAKALTNMAIAAAQRGQVSQALKLFRKAREFFNRERNQVWQALVDLYQAMILYKNHRFADARPLCETALQFFSQSPLASKAALCELLLARLHLEAGEGHAALQMSHSALERLERAEAPAMSFQAYFVLGQAQEALGEWDSAYEAYRKSHKSLESLRSHLGGEELKISFLKDKLSVYESLIWMCLARDVGRKNQEAAFVYIEQAKSRSLADLIAFRAQSLPTPSGTQGGLVSKVQHLREELNWYYHQIEREGIRTEKVSAQRLEHLRQQTRDLENQLLRALLTIRASEKEYSALQNGGSVKLEAIRSALPTDVMLLEYCEARGTIYGAVLSRDRLRIVPLSPTSQVRDLIRLLQFQFSRFRLGSDYVRAFAEPIRSATEAHLRDLYQEMVSPLRPYLEARRLIIVPHGVLHYLPFAALMDGDRFLVDDFALSYAPSASVYYLCCVKQTKAEEGALILGIPDSRTPYIVKEVEVVGRSLPKPRIFLGPEATAACLQKYGPSSRFVHIATHGNFRQDNPMFSSIRLGDSQLTLFDLYHLRFSAELVTLSGCVTGLNVVVGGDELLGLVRGMLYAGAQSVMVSLWDVNDQSTAEFMSLFYHDLARNRDRDLALQHAMRQLRESHPHPYYWAPFTLIGKPTR